MRHHVQRYTCRDNGGILRVSSVNRGTLLAGVARITASLTRVVPGRKFRRGDLAVLLVFGTARWVVRRTGGAVRLGYNGAIALRKDGRPGGSRVYAPAYLETRWAGSSRFATMARFLL